MQLKMGDEGEDGVKMWNGDENGKYDENANESKDEDQDSYDVEATFDATDDNKDEINNHDVNHGTLNHYTSLSTQLLLDIKLIRRQPSVYQ